MSSPSTPATTHRARPRLVTLGTILAVVFAAACGSTTSPAAEGSSPAGSSGNNGGGPSASSSSGGFGEGGAPAQTNAGDCQKVDIVFVIDDSGSMGPKQENLGKNFPKFVQTIEAFRTKGGAALDWRAAVTTTTADGDPKEAEEGEAFGGMLRQSNACKVTQRWIDGNDPDVETKFACLAKVGTGGSPFEEPLRSLRKSLEDRVADGTNAGFRRDDALLAVVVLTDEEDGSEGTVESYIEMLNTAAHGPGRWAFAAIAADKCPATFPLAPQTTTKLKELVAKAGPAGKFSTICPADDDLTPALKEALNTFDAVCKTFPPPVN